MVETVRTALLLLHVGTPPEDEQIRRTIGFILAHQNPDGGWCENPPLEIPSEQTWLSNERSITWLTADVVNLLREGRKGEAEQCQGALTWLRAMQTESGDWPSLAREPRKTDDDTGDPDSTAQIAFLMREIYGDEDPSYRTGRARFEQALEKCAQDADRGYWIRPIDGSRAALDAYHLTHLFLSHLLDPPRRFQTGYDVRDPRAKRILEALVEIQQADGGWRSFWSKESGPLYTALAVRVLMLSGAVSGDTLKEGIRS